ncbi:MAG: hypothetical protein Q9171_000551 [Xanthocarpia ochracea]
MAGFVAAQNSTSGTSGNTDNTVFNVNEVDRTQRGKLRYIYLFVELDPISYSCICTNGTSPDLAAYADTFVSQTCQARFAACRQQNPGSDACVTCGTLQPEDVPMSTSSMAAASSTAAADATSAEAGAEATGAADSSPSNAAQTLMGPMDMVKGAVGLIAAMGLVL